CLGFGWMILIRLLFFFLERDKGAAAHASAVISPEIDSNGRMSCWPDGFFDEWDRQLEKLL
ncbi:MAG: DUF3696 domain-containing protein, partial [Candidatus Electrothrix sp. MAN1_4]|nr:DUF3696 domain-containing protein [Candidatus Electrothrix sp. MAN1_4]